MRHRAENASVVSVAAKKKKKVELQESIIANFLLNTNKLMTD